MRVSVSKSLDAINRNMMQKQKVHISLKFDIRIVTAAYLEHFPYKCSMGHCDLSAEFFLFTQCYVQQVLGNEISFYGTDVQ